MFRGVPSCIAAVAFSFPLRPSLSLYVPLGHALHSLLFSCLLTCLFLSVSALRCTISRAADVCVFFFSSATFPSWRLKIHSCLFCCQLLLLFIFKIFFFVFCLRSFFFFRVLFFRLYRCKEGSLTTTANTTVIWFIFSESHAPAASAIPLHFKKEHLLFRVIACSERLCVSAGAPTPYLLVPIIRRFM